jgi:hypothetical protein
MSKENENQPKNYTDYGYAGDEAITITVAELVALQKGANIAVQNGIIAQHPQVIKWYSTKTSMPVDKPTKKQIESGEVKQMADPSATASGENLQVSFNANIFPEVFESRAVAMGIHQRMVDEGVAKTRDELTEMEKERMNKGQMKVQDDEATAAPRPYMKVVKDSDEESE